MDFRNLFIEQIPSAPAERPTAGLRFHFVCHFNRQTHISSGRWRFLKCIRNALRALAAFRNDTQIHVHVYVDNTRWCSHSTPSFIITMKLITTKIRATIWQSCARTWEFSHSCCATISNCSTLFLPEYLLNDFLSRTHAKTLISNAKKNHAIVVHNVLTQLFELWRRFIAQIRVHVS